MYICPVKKYSRRYTLAKVVLTCARWKPGLMLMCYANWAIYSHNRGVVYIPVTHKPLRWGLIKTSNVGSFPQSRVMRAEQATFVCTLEPLFILKHVLQGSTVALIVWSKGPSFPRVWYNEGERTTHDLQLSQTRYLKQPGPETEQQHWFVPTHGPAPSGPAEVLRVMCFTAR